MRLAYIICLLSIAVECQAQRSTTIVDNGWTPPTKTAIPAAYLSATKGLLGNGLADPRGGEFHKVTVLVSNATGIREPTMIEKQSYGWIVSDRKVVLIDGLKYPVQRDLGPANPEDLFSGSAPVYGYLTEDGIQITGPTLATPALLLVRDETALAEKCFATVGLRTLNPDINLYAELSDRYTMQVAHFLMVHNDPEALEWAKGLADVSECREKAGLTYGNDMTGWQLDTVFPNQLLRDVTRRTEHSKSKFDLAANTKIAAKKVIARWLSRKSVNWVKVARSNPYSNMDFD